MQPQEPQRSERDSNYARPSIVFGKPVPGSPADKARKTGKVAKLVKIIKKRSR